MPLQDELPKTANPTQLAYRLDLGKRFTLGYSESDVRQTASICAVHVDWLEFELEDEQGKPVSPRKFIGVKIDAFRSSILKELTPLTTKEAEARGYR